MLFYILATQALLYPQSIGSHIDISITALFKMQAILSLDFIDPKSYTLSSIINVGHSSKPSITFIITNTTHIPFFIIFSIILISSSIHQLLLPPYCPFLHHPIFHIFHLPYLSCLSSFASLLFLFFTLFITILHKFLQCFFSSPFHPPPSSLAFFCFRNLYLPKISNFFFKFFYQNHSIKLMKNLFLLSLLLLSISSSHLHFSLNKWQHYREGQYQVVYIPCQGGSGNYQYEYTNYPHSWYVKENRIYIPRDELQHDQYYGCRALVYDKVERSTLKKSIIFSVHSNRISQVYDADYDFDYYSSEKVSQYLRSSSRVSHYSNKRNFRSTRSYHQNYEYNFPSWDSIQTLIVQGRVSEIQVIIREVIDSSFRCEKKADFLSILLTRIQSHIAITRTQTEHFRQTLFVLKEQIVILQKELSELEESSFDVEKFRIELSETEISLKRVERDIRNGDHEVYQLTQQIQVIHHRIFQIKTVEVLEIETSIQFYDDEIDHIDSEIIRLQRQLENLEREKQEARSRRQRHVEILSEIRVRITNLNAQITEIQNRIEVIIVEINKSKQVRESLLFKIRRLTIEIERGGNFQNQQRIEEIRILIEQKQTEIQSINVKIQNHENIIISLESSVSSFSNIIDKHYYKCYQIYDNDDDFKDDGFIHVKSSQFSNYLQTAFGHVENKLIRARFSGSVKLKRYNIFSPAWIKVYGIPYTAGYGNNLDIEKDQFSCTTTENLEAFDGVIQSINQNVIVVRVNNEQYGIHLGGCTQIDSAVTNEIPEVGDKIYWKGYEKKSKKYRHSYNAHRVACF